jgi:hypothetical protein
MGGIDRFTNRVLLAVVGDELSQWLASRHQFGVSVLGGVEFVQFMVRAALDALPDWAVWKARHPTR